MRGNLGFQGHACLRLAQGRKQTIELRVRKAAYQHELDIGHFARIGLARFRRPHQTRKGTNRKPQINRAYRASRKSQLAHNCANGIAARRSLVQPVKGNQRARPLRPHGAALRLPVLRFSRLTHFLLLERNPARTEPSPYERGWCIDRFQGIGWTRNSKLKLPTRKPPETCEAAA